MAFSIILCHLFYVMKLLSINSYPLGSTCESEVNECDLNLCNATGTDMCGDEVNGYTCHCRPGYTGEMCEVWGVSCGCVRKETDSNRYTGWIQQNEPIV